MSNVYVKSNFKANVAGHLNRYLNLSDQYWPLKFKWWLSRLAHFNGDGSTRFLLIAC